MRNVIKTFLIISIVFLYIVMSLLLFTFIGEYKKYNKVKNYWQQKCDSFAVQNSNLSKNQIVFVGDSITDLYPLDDYYTDLNLACYNRGIGGDTTGGVLKRMDVSIFDLQPAKIVIMIGINDTDVSQVSNNHTKILEQIKNRLPSSEVFVMSVLPISEKVLDYVSIDLTLRNNQVMNYNASLKALADRLDYTYVDLFSLVVDENNCLKLELTDDGVHLNSAGYTIWTNLLKPMLV